jgi:hypothetical protein
MLRSIRTQHHGATFAVANLQKASRKKMSRNFAVQMRQCIIQNLAQRS